MSILIGKWMLVLLALAGVYVVVSLTSLEVILTPENLPSSLRDLDVTGPFVLMGLMTLSVVVSPIPSLPLELASGATYGRLGSGL
jgi:uncharacterized membrane protein YdjX (TVP38/TMEM64 family)